MLLNGWTSGCFIPRNYAVTEQFRKAPSMLNALLEMSIRSTLVESEETRMDSRSSSLSAEGTITRSYLESLRDNRGFQRSYFAIL